ALVVAKEAPAATEGAQLCSHARVVRLEPEERERAGRLGVGLDAEREDRAGQLSQRRDVGEVPLLSEPTLDELQRPQFLFPAPAHFTGPAFVVFPILTRDAASGEWRVRFRRDNLRATSRAGILAVVELIRTLADQASEVMLGSGTVALINNC